MYLEITFKSVVSRAEVKVAARKGSLLIVRRMLHVSQNNWVVLLGNLAVAPSFENVYAYFEGSQG